MSGAPTKSPEHLAMEDFIAWRTGREVNDGIREGRAAIEKISWRAIAERYGVSHVHLIKLQKGGGLGMGALEKYAGVEYGGRLDALRDAALAWAAEHPERPRAAGPVVEEDARDPELEAYIAEEGVPDDEADDLRLWRGGSKLRLSREGYQNLRRVLRAERKKQDAKLATDDATAALDALAASEDADDAKRVAARKAKAAQSAAAKQKK